MLKWVCMLLGCIGILVNAQAFGGDEPGHHRRTADGKAERPGIQNSRQEPPVKQETREPTPVHQPPAQRAQDRDSCVTRLNLYEKKIELLEARIRQLEGR